MPKHLEGLADGCRTSADVIVKLEEIRDRPGQSEATRRRASFYITEVVEDVLDLRAHFRITDDYLDTITPPPHTGHLLEGEDG